MKEEKKKNFGSSTGWKKLNFKAAFMVFVIFFYVEAKSERNSPFKIKVFTTLHHCVCIAEHSHPAASQKRGTEKAIGQEKKD